MSDDAVDHVPGIDDDSVDALLREAEVGFDLDALPVEPNPHAVRAPVVPADLIEAIEQRASQLGATPAEVVRRALTDYLDSA